MLIETPTTNNQPLSFYPFPIDISSVQVNGYNVPDWICHDPLSNVVMSDITDCHRHPEVKRKMYSSLAECEEGELAIPLPRQVHLRSAGNVGSRVNGDGTFEYSLPDLLWNC